MKRIVGFLSMIILSMVTILQPVLTFAAQEDNDIDNPSVIMTVSATPSSLKGEGIVEFSLDVNNNGNTNLRDLEVILPNLKGTCNITTPSEAEGEDKILSPGQSKKVSVSLNILESELGTPLVFVLNGYSISGLFSADDTETLNDRIQTTASITISKEAPTPTPSPTPTPVADPKMEASVNFDTKMAQKNADVGYHFQLKNTGNVNLNNVKVYLNDMLVQQVDSLEAQKGKTIDASVKLEKDITYTPSVQYDYNGQSKTITLDKVSLYVEDPQITITAKVNKTTPTTLEKVGVEITIKNTGNETLSNLKVLDYMNNQVQISSESLESGKTMTIKVNEQFSKDTKLIYYVNSKDLNGNNIDAKTTEIEIKPTAVASSNDLQIEIKPASTTIASAGSVDFEVIVTNKGKSTLKNIEVSESEKGVIGTKESLEAGKSESFQWKLDVEKSKNVYFSVKAVDASGNQIANTKSSEIKLNATPTPQPEKEQKTSSFPFVIIGILAAVVIALVVTVIVLVRKKQNK